MSDKPTTERDGLHCVYGACRGLPCHPGCSFTMRATDPLEMLRKVLEAANGAQ